jgi:hypothetical protein
MHARMQVRGKDPTRFVVEKVLRIQNKTLWNEYQCVRNCPKPECRTDSCTAAAQRHTGTGRIPSH